MTVPMNDAREELRELSVAVYAEVMGGRVLTQDEMRAEADRWHAEGNIGSHFTLGDEGFRLGVRFIGETEYWQKIPEYAGYIQEAYRVEAEIERRGLGGAYIEQLHRLVLGRTFWSSTDDLLSDFFALVRASPADRCRAALRSLRPEGGK